MSSFARVRAVAAPVTTALAGLLIWIELVAPNRLSALSFGSLLRVPIEAAVLLALAATLPARARQITAALFGAMLGALAVVKAVDMGFYSALDRPFNLWTDRGYLGPAVGVVRDSIGEPAATAVVVGAVLLGLAVPVLTVLAALRVSRLAAASRSRSLQTAAALALVWALCAVLGVHIVDGAPVASTSATTLAYDHVRAVEQAIRDRRVFAAALADDPLAESAGPDLLGALSGKDVIIAFVESYGRVAVEGSDHSSSIDGLLESGARALRADGYAARSAWLTSPTFGGISWLAHSTLQSGLWVDTEQRYDQLLGSERLTLAAAFDRAGWRTVADVPSNDDDWPEGRAFYGYDEIYGAGDVGYRGPAFSYANMPDQYTLAAFHRLELAPEPRRPVMAEIDLVSSHTPWAPLPRMVPWNAVGDGSVFAGMPAEGDSPTTVWRDSDLVRAAYAESIQYSLRALISFVQTYGDDDLVLIVLGDHQPATVVSGEGASRDVPVSIIAHDRSVLSAIASWQWRRGLLPGDHTPVWPMDDFRDRFLTAFSANAPTASLDP